MVSAISANERNHIAGKAPLCRRLIYFLLACTISPAVISAQPAHQITPTDPCGISVEEFHTLLCSKSVMAWPVPEIVRDNHGMTLPLRGGHDKRQSLIKSVPTSIPLPVMHYQHTPDRTPLQLIGNIILGVTKQVLYPLAPDMPDM